MINTLLDEGKDTGELSSKVDSSSVTEILFAGMLGASVIFGIGKSIESLEQSINALIGYVKSLE